LHLRLSATPYVKITWKSLNTALLSFNVVMSIGIDFFADLLYMYSKRENRNASHQTSRRNRRPA
jgi:hypothetical protein